MQQETYVVGVDYGTLSGRALVVRVSDGEELGTAMHDYPHGVMDSTLAATGEKLPPEWALQVPQDYRVERGKYQPNPEAAEAYDGLFAEYQLLHDYFGRGANDVMKRLKAMRREALA